MTNAHFERTDLLKRSYKNVKHEATLLLSAKNCRAMLIAGCAMGAFALSVPLLLSYAVISSIPKLMNSETFYLADGILFSCMSFFLLFFFSPMYCGIYNAAIKISNNEQSKISDLFKFYTTPYLYKRSIALFFKSSWFIYLMILFFGVIYLTIGVANIYVPELVKSLTAFLDSLLSSFILFGGILFTVTRQYKYIYIPYAIENTEVPLKECVAASRTVSYIPFRMHYKWDLLITMALFIASVASIGILQIIYAGPLAVAKKTAYYKAFKYN